MFPYRSSEENAKIEIGFKFVDQERPLAEVACRGGFGTKGPSWMIDFIKFLGGAPTENTIFALLGVLIELCIPESAMATSCGSIFLS